MNYEQQGSFLSVESLPAASRVKISRSQANAPVLPENAPVFIGKLYALWMSFRPSTSSSKTSLAFCHLTEDETWESSSGRLLSGGTVSHGVCLTLNTSESPNVAVECSLSRVLETTGSHLAKYSLSAKACEGILRRASRRGKSLPPMLERALRNQCSSPCEKESQGGGKGPLISTDQSLTLATQNGQVLYEPHHGDGRATEGIANTLAARMGTGGNNIPVLVEPQTFVKVIRSGARDAEGNLPPEVWREEQTNPTLNQFDQGDSRTVVAIVEPTVQTSSVATVVAPVGTVRRLTPTECERLQGFPDGWTAERIDEVKGLVTQADSSRYKQMGNAVAVPVVEWIMAQLVKVDCDYR